MRKTWGLLALLLASPAYAAPTEMSTQTCQDFIDAGEDEQDQMVAWLLGYVAGKSTGTLYDLRAARSDSTKLRGYCQNHLTNGLVSAAGQLKR